MSFVFNSKLDHSFLQSLYEDDISYASEVFEEFLSGTKSEFEAIKTEYQQNSIKNVRQKLHKIKPTFSFVGLTGLTEKTESIIAICDTSSDSSEINNSCLPYFKEIEESLILIENEFVRMKNFAA